MSTHNLIRVSALLAVLCFSSCAIDEDPDIICDYDPPRFEFAKVDNGRVYSFSFFRCLVDERPTNTTHTFHNFSECDHVFDTCSTPEVAAVTTEEEFPIQPFLERRPFEFGEVTSTTFYYGYKNDRTAYFSAGPDQDPWLVDFIERGFDIASDAATNR